MRKLTMLIVFVVLVVGVDGLGKLGTVLFPKSPFKVEEAQAAIKWCNAPHTARGGYYRDTSNDGNPYNNANYLGYND
uniref:Uncharacterized protein n=1 Tax=viral metagenome TaxID=1070528 RepID=A0A6M3JJR2_9ZZZZ